jgi:hypothetical protein
VSLYWINIQRSVVTAKSIKMYNNIRTFCLLRVLSYEHQICRPLFYSESTIRCVCCRCRPGVSGNVERWLRIVSLQSTDVVDESECQGRSISLLGEWCVTCVRAVYTSVRYPPNSSILAKTRGHCPLFPVQRTQFVSSRLTVDETSHESIDTAGIWTRD